MASSKQSPFILAAALALLILAPSAFAPGEARAQSVEIWVEGVAPTYETSYQARKRAADRRMRSFERARERRMRSRERAYEHTMPAITHRPGLRHHPPPQIIIIIDGKRH
ncbi:MAG: hypothetical protein ACNA8W_18695 [Bradymonadaceae bacterium]